MRTINDYPALKCFMTNAELDTVLQGLRVLLFDLEFTPKEMEASFHYEETQFEIDVSHGTYIDMGSYFIWMGGDRLQYYPEKWRDIICGNKKSKTVWHCIKLEELKKLKQIL